MYYGNFLYLWLLSPVIVKMLTWYENMGFVGFGFGGLGGVVVCLGFLLAWGFFCVPS